VKVHLERTRLGFVPASEHDLDILDRVPAGSVIGGEFKLVRNAAHHRKAFALLHKMFANQDRYTDFDRFYDFVKIAAGIVATVIGPDGQVFYKLKSLSFADMDQLEFDAVYQKIITVAVEHFGQDWTLREFA